jgi:hypothetical protein
LNKTELKVTSRRNPSEYAHILMSEKAQVRPIRTKSQSVKAFQPGPDALEAKTGRSEKDEAHAESGEPENRG